MDHGARLETAEANVAGLDARLIAAETLGLPSTPLTETLVQVRDLSSGTPLYTAVDNLRMLAAGTTLTDTLIQVRDLTTGTPLYTAVTGLQSTVSSQDTRLTSAEGGLTALTIRVSAAENLNGTTTALTTTMKALRDLTGGSSLVTTLTALRDNSGSSALVTTLGSLRNKTDSSSALIRSLPCYGESNSSEWQDYPLSPGGLFVNVSMAACGFSAPPQHISTSIFGTHYHWLTLGPSSVYDVTATSFLVYVLAAGVPVAGGNVFADPQTPAKAQANKWRIHWIAAR